LKSSYPDDGTSRNQRLDLYLPNQWAIEVKMLRPYRDNGEPEPAWTKDILSPFARDNSAVTDIFKLLHSGFSEKKGVVIYGLAKVADPDIQLDVAIAAFEAVARGFGQSKQTYDLGNQCHSAATLLLKEGVHPRVAQEMLGHSNVNLTMSIYSHVRPTMHKEAAMRLGDLLRTGPKT
jgi:Phage integrase family